MQEQHVQLFVIGGGINGAAIACDAAGRGLSVALCDKGDLANATSSKSTKLIHGGLRYLQQFEFKLVREALLERETLFHKAPHLIHPLEFVIANEQSLRSKLMLRAGLFLYDHLAQHPDFANSHQISLENSEEGLPLKDNFKTGFTYSDCQTDDCRLVIEYALQAQHLGSKILPRHRCIEAKRVNNHWRITLDQGGKKIHYAAEVLVNASGPWVETLNQNIINTQQQAPVALVKGSHIVIPKLYDGYHAYLLQNDDGRVVFAIPYQQHFTLIGTTDIRYTGDLDKIEASTDEINYLCDVINHHFIRSIQPSEVVWSYAGVRPLYNDASQNPKDITREYKLLLEEYNTAKQPIAPLLTIVGGKITTSRALAEEVMNELSRFFKKIGPPWTQHTPFLGGDLAGLDYKSFLEQTLQQYATFDAELCQRWVMTYGARMKELLADVKTKTDLGVYFGHGLYQKEVDFLVTTEWAQSSEDILWRRSKLGLHFDEQQTKTLDDYLCHFT